MGKGHYPMVPGHEIVGDIVAVGAAVKGFQVGQRGGVGCMVDSCRSCRNCVAGDEQYCVTGIVGTYAGRHMYSHCAEYDADGGSFTQGGYSSLIVVDQAYTLRVPESIPYHTAAPLLCAGITVYSPLKHFDLKPTQKFGVAGIGGLGHMAVKFGVAWGCHTTVISRGVGKRASALDELKAHAFLDSTNVDEMKAQAGTFDFILSTVAAQHDISIYLNLLTTNGKLIVVGVPPGKIAFGLHGVVLGRKTLAGSLIGGIRETQEMLDFCAEHGISTDVEVIPAAKINEAYERTIRSDVKYRFVIDTTTL